MKKFLIFLISLSIASAPLYSMDTPTSWHLVERNSSWYQPTEDRNAKYGDFIKKDVDSHRSISDELLWAKEMNDKEILCKDVTNLIVATSSQLPYHYSGNLRARPFYNELLFAHGINNSSTLPTELTKKITALSYQLSEQNPNPDFDAEVKECLSNPLLVRTHVTKGDLEVSLFLHTDGNITANQPITIEGKDKKFSQGMFNRIQGSSRELREVLAQAHGKDIFIKTNYKEPSLINKLLGDTSTARSRNAEYLGSAAKLMTKITLNGACTTLVAKTISPEAAIGLGAGIIASEIPNGSTPKGIAVGMVMGGISSLAEIRAELKEICPDKNVPITAEHVAIFRTKAPKIAAKVGLSTMSGLVIGTYCNKAGDYVKDQIIDSFKETNTETLKRRGFRMESLLPETDTHEDIKRRYDFNYGSIIKK